ncbi:ABC transporter ATP-binding protein [Vibrio caribbeanicus]|uniref:ABC transporter ATP-binding protein n=1 Tax=Vibrio caribbeanicus TaxID=701175 RepID=UPI0030D990D4
MNTSIIKAKSLFKAVSTNQEQLTILNDINLEVTAGESVAVVGASGAGKSTLMMILAGLEPSDDGEIELLGQRLDRMNDEERAALRSQSIGFVFQNFLLIPSLSALDNVTLPNLLRGESINEDRAIQLLTSVGLKDRINHTPSQLSGGEQQRVAIARAFMINPKVLFADEPTGNLDQKTASSVIDLLFELNERHGTTLVLVTHDEKLAQRCSRRLSMRAGIMEEI